MCNCGAKYNPAVAAEQLRLRGARLPRAAKRNAPQQPSSEPAEPLTVANPAPITYRRGIGYKIPRNPV